MRCTRPVLTATCDPVVGCIQDAWFKDGLTVEQRLESACKAWVFAYMQRKHVIDNPKLSVKKHSFSPQLFADIACTAAQVGMTWCAGLGGVGGRIAVSLPSWCVWVYALASVCHSYICATSAAAGAVQPQLLLLTRRSYHHLATTATTTISSWQFIFHALDCRLYNRAFCPWRQGEYDLMRCRRDAKTTDRWHSV